MNLEQNMSFLRPVITALIVSAVRANTAVHVDSDGALHSVVRREEPKRHGIDKSTKTAVTASAMTESYNFVDEKLPGACVSHYEHRAGHTHIDAADAQHNHTHGSDDHTESLMDRGHLSAAECAEECYKTPGCTRFSTGSHCTMGCRVSVSGSNSATGEAENDDGQCTTGFTGDSTECVVYRLAFFHAVEEPGSCSAHYQRKINAHTTAECAHACKDEPDCTRFTAGANCLDGCRISKCGSNAGGSDCPAAGQCIINPGSGCTIYEVFH